MSALTPAASALRVILYEGLGSTPLTGDERFALTHALLSKGYPVSSARSGADRAPGRSGQFLVLGRFDEAPPGAADADGPGDVNARVHFRAIENAAPPVVLDLVESVRASIGAAQPGAWKPWFPVIDYTRCTNCMQCLSFCLFDVYGVSSEQKIQVQKASNCKTECPACSRVCPEVAILFPKYRSGPINGDEVNAADVEREKMKVDISALLGGDIYAALRQRSQHAQSRFAKERDEKKALEERRRCLVKLQEQLDIPPEVLAALPTLDDIREKAARAAAATKAAEGQA